MRAGITPLVLLDPATNQARYYTDNAEQDYGEGLESSYFFRGLSFLQSYLSQRLYYTDSRIISQGMRRYSARSWSYSFSVNNTIFLNRSKTLQGVANIFYRSPAAGQGAYTNHLLMCDIGLSYTLLAGKLRLATNWSSFFPASISWRVKASDYMLHLVHNQQASLSLKLTYSFGAPIQVKSTKKAGEELRARM